MENQFRNHINSDFMKYNKIELARIDGEFVDYTFKEANQFWLQST